MPGAVVVWSRHRGKLIGVRGSGLRHSSAGIRLAGVSAGFHGAGLDLRARSFEIPSSAPDPPQRLLSPTADPEPADQHPPLPLVEPTQQPRHDLLPSVPVAPLLTRVGAGVDGVHGDRQAVEGEP